MLIYGKGLWICKSWNKALDSRKYTNIKADFGTSFGFLCIGYNKTDHIRMTVLEQIGNITIRNSFWCSNSIFLIHYSLDFTKYIWVRDFKTDFNANFKKKKFYLAKMLADELNNALKFMVNYNLVGKDLNLRILLKTTDLLFHGHFRKKWKTTEETKCIWKEWIRP